MAPLEVSENDIATVIEFAQLNPMHDQEMVINALRMNSGATDVVISEWFESSDKFRAKYSSTWNEEAFSADRDGTAGNSSGISFHIESSTPIEGVSPPNEGFIHAPSRPPSRANSKSPLSNIVNSSEHNVSNMPNAFFQEDDDIERALRESAMEAGVEYQAQEYQGQESGVTGAPELPSTLRPADRTDYDPNDWAMVPISLSSVNNAIKTLIPPSKRRRAEGAPAFLIQSTDAYAGPRIGGLISILHQIPLARNMLLRGGTQASSYGNYPDWWKGLDVEIGDLDLESNLSPTFEEELHRFMAFLDTTDRAYGTSNIITSVAQEFLSTKIFKTDVAEGVLMELFLYRNPDQGRPFRTHVHQISTMDVEGDIYADEALYISPFLELDEPETDDMKYTETFYQFFDRVMWSSYSAEEGSIPVLREVPEVMILKVEGDPFKIPETFFPERWLPKRRDEAVILHTEWVRLRIAREKVEEALDSLNRHWDSNLRELRPQDVILKEKLAQWERYEETVEGAARFRAMEESGFDIDKYPVYHMAPCQMDDTEQNLHRDINKVINLIRKKLEAVIKEKKEYETQIKIIEGQQRRLGSALTDPEKKGRSKPMTCKKFLLRGIATMSNTTYVCQRVKNTAEMVDGESTEDQWWRLKFDMDNTSQPVTTEKLTFEQVHEHAWNDGESPMLVFATEDAMNETPLPLSESLEQFARLQNKAFQRELAHETSQAEPLSTPPSSSPSKRKRRSISLDSMDSNRASNGSDRSDGISPFFDRSLSSVGAPLAIMNDTDDSTTVELKRVMNFIKGNQTNLDNNNNNTQDSSPSKGEEVILQSVEMEERGGSSPFHPLSKNISGDVGSSNNMDMDLPSIEDESSK